MKSLFIDTKSLWKYSLLMRPRQNNRPLIAEIPSGEYILYAGMFLNRVYILASNSSQTCNSVSFPSSLRFFPVAASQEVTPLVFCLHLPLSLWYLYQFNLLEFTALKKQLTQTTTLLKHRMKLTKNQLIIIKFSPSNVRLLLLNLTHTFTKQPTLLSDRTLFTLV